MPKGGLRAGAGRPRKGEVSVSAEVAAAEALGETPLEYMTRVMNDPAVDPIRRDRMAIASAPFIHAKADAAPAGKKAERDAAAKEAGNGTQWEDLLSGPASSLHQ
jgi:hypothetical protein